MSNKVSHQLSHLMLRGQTYYTNFKMKGSTKSIRLSLGTDSLRQAQAMMSRISPYIPLVQSGAMSVEAFKSKLNGMTDLTKQDLDTFLFRTLEADIIEAEYIPQLGKLAKEMGTPIIKPEDTADAAYGYAKAAQSWVFEGNDGTVNLIKNHFQHQNIDPSSLSNEISEASTKLDMSKSKVYQAYQAFYNGDFLKYEQLVNSLKSQLSTESHLSHNSIKRDAVTSKPELCNNQAIKLSEAWKMFVQEKGNHWRLPVAKENQRFYEVLLLVVGDIPVDVITKQHIRDALQVAKNLPSRTIKPYSRMTLEECINLTQDVNYDVPEDDLISSEHVHKHLKIWRSLFSTFLVEQKDILLKAPTEGINYKIEPNRGGHYSETEMCKLKMYFNGLPCDDRLKLYFLTLIYTGARRGEIADIKKEHIKQNDDTGRYYIAITGGKSKHAKRNVPVHKLIEPLLLKHISTLSSNDLVFSDLPDYTTITQTWVNIMRELKIPDHDEFGLKRRIHSLRHTFISKAITAIVNHTLVQFVVGHSRTRSLGLTNIYVHAPPIKDLLPVVDCIE
ncbi:tyrosine-type recombinase/integrase [Yersinia massiliensis]|uniref:tyrosine-type recombinase/integrase n=1 Tax=Yersinia massiliensis TaxID=419257 RepID=UPI000C148C66|nr:tyrosine-type recombinase/integrase [Yersinia massiliensis]PHZ25550.1 recombinase XerC [Yersinia massiliensis]